MIDAHIIHDAISLFPEELLAPVDALRRKKRIAWKPIATVAASILLVIGLWQLWPMAKSAEKGTSVEDAAGGTPYNGFLDGYGNESNQEYSTSLYSYSFTGNVTEIAEDHWVVTLSEGQKAAVYWNNLDEPVKVTCNTEIVLLFTQKPTNFQQLHPDEIIVK